VNVNEALVDLVGDAGPDPDGIAGAGGGVVSIVHVYEAAALVPVDEPAAPTARTWKVCEPGASGPAYAIPLEQDANDAASSLHSKVAFVASVVNVNVAVWAFVGLAGFVPIVGTAGTATDQVYVVSPLVLPPFDACTLKV
jgi:hypothetical protein